MWLSRIESSPSQHHHLLVLYSSLSTLTLINVSWFFTAFRVLNDIKPLVIQRVILITELIFLIYVLGWQSGTILSRCRSFTLFHYFNFLWFSLSVFNISAPQMERLFKAPMGAPSPRFCLPFPSETVFL